MSQSPPPSLVTGPSSRSTTGTETTFYHIQVKKVGPETGKTRKVWVEGAEQPDGKIHLFDDGRERQAIVGVG